MAGRAIAISQIKRGLPAAPTAGDLEQLQARTNSLADGIRHPSHELHPALLEHLGPQPEVG